MEERVRLTFEEFVRDELASLVRFAGAVTGDEHAAQDVLAEALMRASVRWRRVGAMADPAAYVRRIVVTTHLSEQRTRKRRRTDPTGDESLLDGETADPVDVIVQRDEINRLLARLTRHQRVALVLRYLCDYDDARIATVLGCSSDTVRSHISHAKAVLRMSGPAVTDWK